MNARPAVAIPPPTASEPAESGFAASGAELVRRPLRVLLVADTHLGLDLPLHPQVQRRRRGADFLANFRRALEPALRGEVDLVVHGGDLFDRSRVHPALVQIALAPLLEVAAAGVPRIGRAPSCAIRHPVLTYRQSTGRRPRTLGCRPQDSTATMQEVRR